MAECRFVILQSLHSPPRIIVGNVAFDTIGFALITDKLNSVTVMTSNAPHNRYIKIDFDYSVNTPEYYTMISDVDRETITIKGSDNAGVFYGIQTVLSLASVDGTVPHGQVTDQPRFEYRGMHIDVARNFRPVEDIKRLLEAMAMYKMNKFHIHLSDDEGWRLEVPSLPELTEVSTNYYLAAYLSPSNSMQLIRQHGRIIECLM